MSSEPISAGIHLKEGFSGDPLGWLDEPNSSLTFNEGNTTTLENSTAEEQVSHPPDISEKTFEFAIHGVAIPIISGFGFVANILCLIVMNQSSMRKSQHISTYTLLSSLAASDICVLISRYDVATCKFCIVYKMKKYKCTKCFYYITIFSSTAC